MFPFLSRRYTPKTQSLNTMCIDGSVLLSNLAILQGLQPDSHIFPVLKSNAYGHGLQQVASCLKDSSVKYICVDSIPEYQIVKKYARKKSLLLWETLPANYKYLDHKRLTPCIYTTDTLRALIATRKPRNVHLFLNTWMNREGIQSWDLSEFLTLIQWSNIRIEWVLSHFANADELDHSFCTIQIEQYKKMYEKIMLAWFDPVYRHIWNTAAMAKIQDPFFNARRSGLWFYGYSPLSEEDKYSAAFWDVRPALEVRSTIVWIQHITAWEIVSYGWSYKAKENMSVATVPYGYTEWLTRQLKNNRKVLWNWTSLEQLWTICMNLCMIDTQWLDVKIWDKVTIISSEISSPNTIIEFALKTNTIPYEVLVNLDPKAKRILI